MKPKKKPCENLGFGNYFTDHMLSIHWTSKDGWHEPKISEYSEITISPAMKVLHYATSAFEGFKAVRGVDNVSRIFRIDKHLQRFKTSAERICLPSFDPNELMYCIKALVKLDKDWIPGNSNESLYIRPFMFDCDPSLGVSIPSEASLYTILSPVGSYFKHGYNGVNLYVDGRFTRSCEGGCGAFKLSANYAPTLHAQKIAEARGCQTSLWLYGPEERLTEAGTMNVFVFWTNKKGEKELLTPPLSGLILPGITRASILEITKKWNEFKVVEENITMSELLTAISEKRVHAIFGTGTACVVSSVSGLVYKDVQYQIPGAEEPNSIPKRIFQEFMDIQLCKNGPHPWMEPIE